MKQDETLTDGEDKNQIAEEEVLNHHHHEEEELNHHEEKLISNHHDYSEDDLDHHEIIAPIAEGNNSKRQFLSMLWDVAYNMSIVGGTSFRGGVVQLMARFCDKAKWLTENEFMEVYMMSHIVPGPKPSQIAMALGKFEC